MAAATAVTKRVRATAIDTLRHSARKQLIFTRRQLSSATALASDPPHTASSYSRETGQDHPHNNQGTQGKTAVSPSKPRRSRSASKQITRSDDLGSKPVIANISGSPTLDIDPSSSPRTATSPKTRSKTKTAAPPSTDSTKHDHSISWNFPSPNGTRRQIDTKPTDTMKYWALAGFYNALHQLQSSATKDLSRSSTLRTALSHYNYLSRQQSLYDTPLIQRKETRSLFVLQAREPKTRHNLEQLLRIAADLIWLNEKDRQLKRRNNNSNNNSNTSKSNGNSGSGISDVTLDMPYVHNQANNFHGLRVSEYTVLMNWIGCVPSTTESGTIATSSPTTGSNTTASNATSSASSSSSSILSNSSRDTNALTISPADRVWGIWHDFLLTGMSPDVVLYTAVIGALLKANEYDRVGQIWKHMHRRLDHQNQDQGRHSHKKDTMGAAVEDMDLVSKTLNLGTSTSSSSSSSPLLSTVSNVDEASKGRRKSNAIDLLDSENQRARLSEGKRSQLQNRKSVTPNIQTYSVLMQTHVLKKDIQGVAQTYKEVLQSAAPLPPSTSASKSTSVTSSSEKQRQQQQQQQHGTRANTVFLNQILTALVNIGENKAAKDIYAAMRQDRDQTRSTSATTINIDNAGEEEEATPSIYAETQAKPDELNRSGDEVGSTANDEYTSKVAFLPTPLASSAPVTISSFLTGPTPASSSSNSSPVHHRNSERRSTWLRRVVHEARKPQSSVYRSKSPSSPSSSSSSSTLLSSIQPNNTTHKLILKMARRKNDAALEEIVLKDLDPDSS
ncbi:hypothetical protein BGX26_008762 [Mortierella sp. AD094]|nr:hypothetical protein BGX26_008762 [Mortierella sp. AD094]